MESMYTKITKAILQKTIAGKNYVAQDFFVGLTDDPTRKLFIEHKVDKKNGLYVYFKAQSTDEAKKVFDELFNLDMNGTPVPDFNPGEYVYCYHINGLTIECPKCN